VFFSDMPICVDPSSALCKVVNFVEKELVDHQTGAVNISFKPVMMDLFLDLEWQKIEECVFKDGATNLPDDLPPPEDLEQNDPNWGSVFGVRATGAIVMGVVVFFFCENHRKENDSVWMVWKEELKFDNPPEHNGSGSFGFVLLAKHGGTQVAVKRVLPLHKSKAKGKESRLTSFELQQQDCAKSVNSGSRSSTTSFAVRSGMGGDVSGIDCFTGSRAVTGSDWRKLKQEFMEEMRHLSKLRHPCITTVMGKFRVEKKRTQGVFDSPTCPLIVADVH